MTVAVIPCPTGVGITVISCARYPGADARTVTAMLALRPLKNAPPSDQASQYPSIVAL